MEKDNDIIGTKIKPTPVKDSEIGIDTNNTLVSDMLDAAEISQLDMSNLEGFSNVSQTREQVYTLIDTMAEDDRVSSVLETYAEDTVETNELGQVIWSESSDASVNKYVNYLLKALNVNKNAYEWAYSLCKYGDVYLKLYRESEYGEDLLFGKSKENTLNEDLMKDSSLKEDVNIHLNAENDHFVHYVEMVPNPAEMFELTKFGKTMGFIKAPVKVQSKMENSNAINSYLTYKMNKNDVEVYDATSFVHASLTNDNSMRCPEEVKIFIDDEDDEQSTTYRVKKGQSILYNLFRIWRELSLLENSVLLNRLTKSAIVRILNVDVGDMPKEQVNDFMTRLKSKIEQKSAINVGQSMQEYTNPGPIENIIYVPTHGTQGTITAQAIGGDVDPKQLTDLEYFQNKFYGALRVPKQYFAQTDDGAGFNGGSSLSIISSRYGKVIKRIQNTICQLITDVVNIFLLDKGLKSYVNKFTIRMQAPITQEEIDRRENMRNRMGVINDIMGQVSSVVTDDILKLKITKSLLATAVTEPDVIDLLQQQIDILEKEKEKSETKKDDKEQEDEDKSEFEPSEESEEFAEPIPSLSSEESEIEEEPIEEPEETEEQGEESYLPSPDELGIDLTTND